MIIRIEKPLLESMQLAKALAKNEFRTQLTGIMFEENGTVWASNGHVALVARTGKAIEKNIVLNIDKTPATGRKYHTAVIDTQQSLCHFVPEFEGMAAASDEEMISRAIAVGKAETVSVNRVIEMANPIPPEVKPVSEIVFDADYLGLLPKIADLFSKQEGGKFAFKLTGDNTASLIKVRAGQGYMLTFIIMPIKI